jgi:cyanophycinase
LILRSNIFLKNRNNTGNRRAVSKIYIHSVMNCHKLLLGFIIILFSGASFAQVSKKSPKGKLFVIGGGDRTPLLMHSLAKTANLGANDYVVVLPMSSGEPDSSFFYFKEDWVTVSGKPLVNFNFTKDRVNDKQWLDSLANAKLVFITGGDQFRFMKAVQNTPVHDAIHQAYQNGATIAGTSAGAAVMSGLMITGRELTDTTYRPTFRKLKDKNIELVSGLGLITTAIIDQHFIVRSRYNRLLSALALHPKLTGIGIDEETAIIVSGNKAEVAGERQVIVLKRPINLKVLPNNLIKFTDIDFGVYTHGDRFLIQ